MKRANASFSSALFTMFIFYIINFNFKRWHEFWWCSIAGFGSSRAHTAMSSLFKSFTTAEHTLIALSFGALRFRYFAFHFISRSNIYASPLQYFIWWRMRIRAWNVSISRRAKKMTRHARRIIDYIAIRRNLSPQHYCRHLTENFRWRKP